MKPKPNDPCPCQSGKKYKRCCGSPGAGLRLHGSSLVHHAQVDLPTVPEAFPSFEDGNEPTAPVTSPALFNHITTAEQQAYILAIGQMLRRGNRESAQAALDAIEAMPASARRFLHPVVERELAALEVLSRPVDYARCLLQFLVDANDQQLWLEKGLLLESWLATEEGSEEALPALLEACRIGGCLGAQLITAMILTGQEPEQRTMDLFDACVDMDRWRAHPQHHKAWLAAIAVGAVYPRVVDSHSRPVPRRGFATLGRLSMTTCIPSWCVDSRVAGVQH